MKTLFTLSILTSIVLADSLTPVQFSGVDIAYKDTEILVKRFIDSKCKSIGITPENIFAKNLAAEIIPNECKKDIVTSLGAVQPISMDDEIKTVGELEVLKFLSLLEFESEKYALVDARSLKWYIQMSIPGAINIPYSDMNEDADYAEEYERMLKLLHISKNKNGTFNFSVAKEIIVFCNASWCVQSVWAIESLVEIGYPKNKISWYRGGLQDWASLGFTTVKP